MTITIKTLTFNTIIGLLEHERTQEQRVVIDAVIQYDYETRFINYANVSDAIKSVMRSGRFELIEEALLTLKTSLKSDFPLIKTLTLNISKPDILPDCEVSVSEHFKF